MKRDGVVLVSALGFLLSGCMVGPRYVRPTAPVTPTLGRQRHGKRETDGSDVEIALREALANAIIHGNHEDRRKHVHVTCRCEPDEMSIAVRMKEKDSTLIMSRTPQPWKTSSRFTAMAST